MVVHSFLLAGVADKAASKLTELTDWRLLFGELDAGSDAILQCVNAFRIVNGIPSAEGSLFYTEARCCVISRGHEGARGSKIREIESQG